jgi:hypothetical protein
MLFCLSFLLQYSLIPILQGDGTTACGITVLEYNYQNFDGNIHCSTINVDFVSRKTKRV